MRRAGDDEFDACYAIRREVFVVEQLVPEAIELDEHDPTADHWLAFRDGEAIGTARMRVVEGDMKAERVAVLARERRGGVGRVLMEAIEGAAQSAGCARVVLNAQVGALSFYEGLGYRAEGERFLEAGIPHLQMTKRLAGVSPP